ncbi:MAG: hypothetical protein JJT75_07000 [Opitutales bacterium]|nr:hypothetical protein [Opitutales bacterium]MCH8539424.1 hypothetical protein [Opitutales bacterium]
MKTSIEKPPLLLGNLWQDMFQIHTANLTPQPLPDPFQTTEKRGEIELKTQLYSLFNQWEIRLARVTSPKIDILNLYAFPFEKKDLPVVVMEMVRFGPKPLVAVADLIGFGEQSRLAARKVLRLVHSAYPSLKNSQDPPVWFQECRSGEDFFIRPQNLLEWQTCCFAFRQLWKKAFFPLPGVDPSPEAHQALGQYKQHHLVNSPSRPFLQKTFGASWTEDYLHKVLLQ